MSLARQSLGQRGERLVAGALRREGTRILARNVRVAAMRGEMDLIALEGTTLVFVEVKTLRTGTVAGPERPVLAVGPRKRRKLRALARAWLAENAGRLPRYGALRFDVIGLRVDPHGRIAEWEHIRGAF